MKRKEESVNSKRCKRKLEQNSESKVKEYILENVIHLEHDYDALQNMVRGLNWKEGIDYQNFRDLYRNLFMHVGGFPFSDLNKDIKSIIFNFLRMQRERNWILVCKEWRNNLVTKQERQIALFGTLATKNNFPSVKMVLKWDYADIAEKMIEVGILTLDPTQQVHSLFRKVNGKLTNGKVILERAIKYKATKILGRAITSVALVDAIAEHTDFSHSLFDTLLLDPLGNQTAISLYITSECWSCNFIHLWRLKIPLEIMTLIVTTLSTSQIEITPQCWKDGIISSLQQEIELNELFEKDTTYLKKVKDMYLTSLLKL